jgi:hypothetical protein
MPNENGYGAPPVELNRPAAPGYGSVPPPPGYGHIPLPPITLVPEKDAGAAGALSAHLPGAEEMIRLMFDEVKQSRMPNQPGGAKTLPLRSHLENERFNPHHAFPQWSRQNMNQRLEQWSHYIHAKINEMTQAGEVSFKDFKARIPADEWHELQGFCQAISRPKDRKHMVEYLNAAQRAQCCVEVDSGLICIRQHSNHKTTLVPFDTLNSEAALPGRPNVAIWVEGPSGRFYTSRSAEAGKFHHSSFLAGRAVKAAGDWMVINGEVYMMAAMSGHYHPPLPALQEAIRDLQTMAVDMSEANVQMWEAAPPQKQVFMKADAFSKLPASEVAKFSAFG